MPGEQPFEWGRSEPGERFYMPQPEMASGQSWRRQQVRRTVCKVCGLCGVASIRQLAGKACSRGEHEVIQNHWNRASSSEDAAASTPQDVGRNQSPVLSEKQ